MTPAEIRTALEMGAPLDSLYAAMPHDPCKALARFAQCFGLSADAIGLDGL